MIADFSLCVDTFIFKFASLFLKQVVLFFYRGYADLYLTGRVSALHSWYVFDKDLEREGEWVPTDDRIGSHLAGSAHYSTHWSLGI